MKERIMEFIGLMNEAELLSTWNEYVVATQRSDDYIYYMEEFNDICNNMKPSEIVTCVQYGNFSYGHDYFWFNGYGNFVSGWNVDSENSPVSIEEMADYIIENDEDFGNYGLRDLLDEINEETEE